MTARTAGMSAFIASGALIAGVGALIAVVRVKARTAQAAIIVKDLFLAKGLNRIGKQILRDHRNTSEKYLRQRRSGPFAATGPTFPRLVAENLQKIVGFLRQICSA